MKIFSNKLAKFLVNNPIKLIFLSLIGSFILASGLKYFDADFSYRIWFRTSDPLIKTYDEFERKFGNDDTVVVLVHSPSGIFDSDSITIIRELTENLWQVPDIIKVDSLTNYQWTHAYQDDIKIEDFIPEEFSFDNIDKRKEIAVNHHVLPDYLINKDATVSLLYAKVKPYPGGAPNDALLINKSKEAIEKIVNKSDHRFYINGATAINNTFRVVAEEDSQTMVPMVLVVITIFLIIFFKKLVGILIPFAVIFLSLISTLGFSGFIGIKFNNMITMIPIILIAISIADTVHVLVTYFQYRKMGNNEKDATLLSFKKNISPTLLTSVSTSIGFLSFSQADLLPLADLGILAAFGTMYAWIITLTLVAPLLVLIPVKVKINVEEKQQMLSEKLTPKYFDFLFKFRKPVFIVSLFTFFLSVYVGFQNEVNSNPYAYFAENVPLRIANEFGLEKMGGVTGPEIIIHSGKSDGIKSVEFLKKVEKFEQWLLSNAEVSKLISIIDIIKSMNMSFNGDQKEFYKIPETDKAIAELLFLYTMSLPQGMDINDRISLDYESMRMTMLWSSQDSLSALANIDKYKKAAKDQFGLDMTLTGKIPIYQGMNDLVVDTFFTSISFAIIGISILLIFAFASIKVGFASMLPNIIPLGFGAAIMTILSKPIDIGTALVTSVCLGIVVDDTVHFLSNYNKYRKQGMSNKEAVKRVITYTGPALFTTSFILMAGFGIMAFSSFIPNVNFGILSAVVLGIALLIDLTFLPAMLLLKEK